MVTPDHGRARRHAGDGYVLTAKFDNIGGLKVGAPVSMAGVTVGRVTGDRIRQLRLSRARPYVRVDPQFRHKYHGPTATRSDELPARDLCARQAEMRSAASNGGMVSCKPFYKACESDELTQSALVLWIESLISSYSSVNFARAEGKRMAEAKATHAVSSSLEDTTTLRRPGLLAWGYVARAWRPGRVAAGRRRPSRAAERATTTPATASID